MRGNDWLQYKNWAVIGASSDPTRYSYRIIHELVDAGYQVYPVSPNLDSVLGLQVYDKISDITAPIEVVDFVVNPQIGIHIVEQCIERGVKRIVLQPGSSSLAIISKAQTAGIEIINACVLVMLKWRSNND